MHVCPYCGERGYKWFTAVWGGVRHFFCTLEHQIRFIHERRMECVKRSLKAGFNGA